MTIYNHKTLTFAIFLTNSARKNYAKYSNCPVALAAFNFIQARTDMLIGAINCDKPALQGLLVDLEDMLYRLHGGPARLMDSFFITMLGAMAADIVAEHKYYPKRSGNRLKHGRYISSATTYTKTAP